MKIKWFLILSFIIYPTLNPTFLLAKVIVDDFHWQISETPHFQIYHYEKSNNILPLVAYHLEKGYKKVIRDFDYKPKEKTPFFLYLTHNQFEQTNIVDIDEGTGGVSEMLKNRFIVPHTGSEKELEHVLTHEFTHILTFNILYGTGFWKSLRLLKTPVYPLWVMEGIAEYEGGENDATTREMYLRDATLNKQLIPLTQLHNFNHLKPHQVILAYKEGESILHFIAEEYGEEKVLKLLFDFLDKLDISSVLMSTLGLDLFTLDDKWQEYLEDKYEEVINSTGTNEFKEPEFYGVKLTTRPSSGNLYDFNTNAVWSPDGEKIAFLSDRNGETELYLMNKDGKNLRRIVGIKNRGRIDLIQRNYTLYRAGNDLSFSPDGRWIAFIGEKNERDYLFLYDLKRKKLKKVNLLTLDGLDTISQPSFSPDGESILFVGMKGGINDLYLYELGEKKLLQLNTDPNDDRAPSFSPAESAGKWIVFSREENREYNLALLNIETKEIVPLTDIPGDEIMPSFSKDGKKIIFVSDKNGIYNLYLLDLKTEVEQQQVKEIKQITEIKGGIFTPQFSPDGKEILFTAFSKGEMNIYRGKVENFGVQQFSPVSEVSSFLPPEAPEEVKVSLSKNYPYRFHASTDLFFPVFWFSTEGGFISGYWQISEYLGNHQLSTTFNYSEPGTVFEYQLDYTYRRWRPQFGVSLLGQSYFDEDTETKNYLYGNGLQMSYPLDRFNRIDTSGIFWFIKTPELNLFTESKLNLFNISYIRDTLQGKYLEPRFGSFINLSYSHAGRSLGGNFTFEKYIFYWQKVFPLFGLQSRFHSLVLRGLFSNIKGADVNEEVVKESFWPEYLIRGYGDLKERNLGLMNLEFRFPIFADINYHFLYLIPDLFFKYLGGVIFTDAGYLWKEKNELKNVGWKDLKNSVGIGLRLNLFIIQIYPLTIGLDWAKRTDSKESKWHFYILPTFYLDVALGKKGFKRTPM
jgi:Tol biopolymer transport system component